MHKSLEICTLQELKERMKSYSIKGFLVSEDLSSVFLLVSLQHEQISFMAALKA